MAVTNLACLLIIQSFFYYLTCYGKYLICVATSCYMFRWVPIKGNDWYWIRHHVKPGMKVYVEILVSNLKVHFSTCVAASEDM
jgi:hypothetical protein